MGDISGGLASKRARISGTDSVRGGEIVVKAQVPLSELEGYAAELKSVTAGRGRYSLDFSHYEPVPAQVQQRSEEHTSELQSLMRISYAVFCLTKKKNKKYN